MFNQVEHVFLTASKFTYLYHMMGALFQLPRLTTLLTPANEWDVTLIESVMKTPVTLITLDNIASPTPTTSTALSVNASTPRTSSDGSSSMAC